MEKFVGKTKEEALLNAAKAKGCYIDELTYVVTEEKSGIFGIGSKVEIEAYFDGDIEKFIAEYLKTYFEGINMEVDVKCQKEDYFFKVELTCSTNSGEPFGIPIADPPSESSIISSPTAKSELFIAAKFATGASTINASIFPFLSSSINVFTSVNNFTSASLIPSAISA